MQYWPGWNGIFEILVLAIAIYYILLFISGTRGAQVLSGLVVLLVSLIGVTYLFKLDALSWLLQRFSAFLAVALLVIFQPEIRRALAELGTRQIFVSSSGGEPIHEIVVNAVMLLAKQKIGAIIAIERGATTMSVQESGTRLDAIATPELLGSIFFPHTPLHDGGVIIKGTRIVAAGCLFPLTQRQKLSSELGTRHRAAIGMTEETDALVVVVSEETGTISVAYRGKLRRGFDEERLTRVLGTMLRGEREARLQRLSSPFAKWVRVNFSRWLAAAKIKENG
jgi:diadenylate cyclase